MSASAKKKLRKEQNAAKLTEKQKREQQEAKKLKAYTITFVAILLVIAITAASLLVVNGVNRSGVIEKNTIAVEVNDHDISVAELKYFYRDAINNLYLNYYLQYQDMASLYMQFNIGLDPNTALNKQVQDPATGATWADYFVDNALTQAKYYYAIYDDAMANNFTLTEEEIKTMNSSIPANDESVVNMYGFGSALDSYKRYREVIAVVQSYTKQYSEALTYETSDLRAYEADKMNTFHSYNYASYQISYANFLGEGVKGEDGSTTYTDEQTAAAKEEAKQVAESLLTATNVTELDAAIAALPMNESVENAASVKNEKVLYSNIEATIQQWVADPSRQQNDITMIPYTSTDADGNESVAAYFVVMFDSSIDNVNKMGDVRHCLVNFPTGTGENGAVTDEQKATAKAEAEQLLADWKKGDATEESFIAMVSEKTDDNGSKTTGGLYENIHRDSNYVPNFEAWAIDPTRAVGDTDIIETEHGYHIMYYVGDSAQTYRDYLVETALHDSDYKAWETGIEDAANVTDGNTDRLQKNIIMAGTYY